MGHAEDEIRQLDNAVREAMLTRDAEALTRLCSDDFVVTNPFHRILTKDQVISAVREGRLRHTAFERQVEYLRSIATLPRDGLRGSG